MARDRQVSTPWGRARVAEAVSVEQDLDEQRVAVVIELLETPEHRLVRFAYTSDGIARRGPVTLRATDLAALRRKLDRTQALGEALRPLEGS